MSSSFEPGSIIAGRYRVLRVIGTGGLGQVYQVADEELRDTNVALKLLRGALQEDPKLFERFRAEVLIARGLRHPNIVHVYDLGRTTDGTPFLTMEYVEGETLRERIARVRAELTTNSPTESHTTRSASSVAASDPNRTTVLPLPEILRTLNQLLDAVGYAHRRGVIHRDLKPGNIVVTSSGEIKLLDFGTARSIQSDLNLTQTGEVIGTPLYMAPEMVRGENVDARCDLYAIGLIAAEMILGEHPVRAQGTLDALVRQLHEPLPPLVSGRFSAPDWLGAVIERATAKDRTERIQSAEEFIEALSRSVPPSAQAHSPQLSSARTGSSARFTGLALVLLLLLLVVVVPLVRDRERSLFPASSIPSPHPTATPESGKGESPANTSRVVSSLAAISAVASPAVETIHEMIFPESSPRSVPSVPPDVIDDVPATPPIATPDSPGELIPELPPLSPSVSSPGSPIGVRTPMTTPIAEPATPPDVDPVGSELLFRVEGSLEASVTFTREELSKVRWVAEIQENSPTEERRGPTEVVLEIRDPSSGTTLLTSYGRVLALPRPGIPSLRIGGDFRTINLRALERIPSGESAEVTVTLRVNQVLRRTVQLTVLG